MSTLYEDEMDLERCPHHNIGLGPTNISSKCNACYEEDDHNNKQGHKCVACDFCVHEECINLNIPSRHKHPLKLTSSLCYSIFESCCLCEEDMLTLLYQCSQCDFRICIPCTRKPLIFNQAKVHKHELHQVPMKLSFTCDACGLCSSNYPCICLQCCFIIHRKCISLPRVIYINRHDHRIAHVSSLGPENWICGVCRKTLNGEYGAYACLDCSYVAHSKCATARDIWDGIELEGIPEEERKGNPFEMINPNLIKHFSHQHNLEVSLGREEDQHCYACTLPFNSARCYRCRQCDFILHDACANLPLRKRHPLRIGRIDLCVEGYFVCAACRRYCNGFSYDNSICVKCASVTDVIEHKSHPHCLFPFSDGTPKTCKVCGSMGWVLLHCIDPDICGGFTLCFTCATQPTMVRHKYDDHPLSLCYGEGNVNSRYCCGVCEGEVYPKRGFYWCGDCNSTLHTTCVFRDFLHPIPGYSIVVEDKGTFELLPNDSMSRPTCCWCKIHCRGDFVLNNKADTREFMCCSCGFHKY